jgi:methionyl-tRNA formyltransferase
VKDKASSPRVLLWGTAGNFALSVLQALLHAHVTIIGVVLPGIPGTGWRRYPPPQVPDSDLQMLPSFVSRGLAEQAWEHHIPVYRMGGDLPDGRYQENSTFWNELLVAVTEMAPTVIVVACWHIRLPDPLLAIPTWGGFNIHPSLLPAFRGPTPLFWQRRAGLNGGGVTIHSMVHQWDAGAIVAQSPLSFPDGATMDLLDQQTGTMGGNLLIELLAKMAMGMASATPQPTGGSYQSFPTLEDFVVPTTWTARHAWNFMRVAESFGTPFTIQGVNRTIVAHRAFDLQPGIIIPEPLLVNTSRGMAVQFQSGVLMVE